MVNINSKRNAQNILKILTIWSRNMAEELLKIRKLFKQT